MPETSCPVTCSVPGKCRGDTANRFHRRTPCSGNTQDCRPNLIHGEFIHDRATSAHSCRNLSRICRLPSHMTLSLAARPNTFSHSCTALRTNDLGRRMSVIRKPRRKTAARLPARSPPLPRSRDSYEPSSRHRASGRPARCRACPSTAPPRVSRRRGRSEL
jgi:hypothetical protein